jgi:hypothetical protein
MDSTWMMVRRILDIKEEGLGESLIEGDESL